VAGVFFLVWFGIWLGGAFGFHADFVPEWFVFFTRSACLFPSRATEWFDHHAEGWDCTRQHWFEIDTRPYFPTIVSGRETRFDRAMRLFETNKSITWVLRAYVIGRWNHEHPDDPVADVRLSSEVTPVPAPGAPIQHYEDVSLIDAPHVLCSDSQPPPCLEYWDDGASRHARDDRCTELLNEAGLPVPPSATGTSQ
jgi:hypothetical protein